MVSTDGIGLSSRSSRADSSVRSWKSGFITQTRTRSGENSPTNHAGGELVVEHAGESRTFRGSKDELSLVAFYADCRHEARPVETGYRVVLTYDLRLKGSESEPGPEAETADELAGHLRTYFETPLPPRWEHRRAAVVLWPRERRFAVRTEAAPRWTVDVLLERLRDGRVEEAREIVRDAAARERAGSEAAVALDRLGERAAEWLRPRLSRPARAEDDWSMTLPADRDCELCERLEDFLGRSDRQRLEWPIAKERRKHVHRRIDHAELPVDHRTRRTGSPYTLVLTKRPELFEREAGERNAWRKALEWLEASGHGGAGEDPVSA